MKPEIKAKVIAALRSGEYKQETGVLRTGDCFCYEGVLCDLASKDGVGVWDGNAFVTRSFESHYSAPSEVLEWAGETDRAVYVFDHEGFRYLHSLASFNDGVIGRPLTFSELADILEEQE